MLSLSVMQFISIWFKTSIIYLDWISLHGTNQCSRPPSLYTDLSNDRSATVSDQQAPNAAHMLISWQMTLAITVSPCTIQSESHDRILMAQGILILIIHLFFAWRVYLCESLGLTSWLTCPDFMPSERAAKTCPYNNRKLSSFFRDTFDLAPLDWVCLGPFR